MIRTFTDAVKFLESYIPTPEKKHPGELGLKRMKKLVELLGNPQFAYPTIHVGGTSGKGSTSTIIATILAQKYKVGLHTSPHLVKITERIKIGSKDIPDNDFIGLLNEIYPAIKKIEESKLGAPSYFEIVTVMAFLHFKKKKVDIAVIEVGMGGRYDATNVIRPEVAVITNVGLDHTEILGTTVEKIAHDKAGIIKSGISVVSGVKQPSVIEIIRSKCKVQSAKLLLLGEDFKYKIKKVDENGSVFDYKGEKLIKNLKLRLLGGHQVENAVLAIRVIELLSESAEVGHGFFPHLPNSPDLIGVEAVGVLKKHDLPADSSSVIKKGLKQAYILGRLEIISRNPLVILDGAHNPEKMNALVTAIKDIFPKKKITAVIAIKSGKNAYGILKEILPICHEVIFTKFRLTTDLGDTFSYTPAELFKISARRRLAEVARRRLIKEDPMKALNEAIKNTDSDDLILITGSLYLIGELLNKIRSSKSEILSKFK